MNLKAIGGWGLVLVGWMLVVGALYLGVEHGVVVIVMLGGGIVSLLAGTRLVGGVKGGQ